MEPGDRDLAVAKRPGIGVSRRLFLSLALARIEELDFGGVHRLKIVVAVSLGMLRLAAITRIVAAIRRDAGR